MEELENGMSNVEFLHWVALANLDHLEQERERLKGGRRGG